MTLGPLMIDVAGTSLTDAEIALLQDPRVGGVILFSRNVENREQVRALVTAIHAVRQPQLLVAVDQEGGRVQRLRDGFTALPPARWLGRQFDIDASHGCKLARLCGWIMAAELRDVGIDLSFAPVVDLDSGLSEVIGDRALHERPDAVARLAICYLQGMRSAGMIGVGKHFPGHGAVVADSHLELPVDHRDADAVEHDISPYRRLIANGLQAVMMAHVRYDKIDRRIASLSPYWIQTELRENLAFRGVVFSDDLDMSAMAEVGSMPERARQALNAGSDMILICNNPEGVAETLAELQAIANPVSQARLVTLRPSPVPWETATLRESDTWREAIDLLAAAVDPPTLQLDG